jgi:hypothetical protein
MLKVFNIIGASILLFVGVHYLFSNEMVEGWHYGIMTLVVAGHWVLDNMRNGRD